MGGDMWSFPGILQCHPQEIAGLKKEQWLNTKTEKERTYIFGGGGIGGVQYLFLMIIHI